MKPYRKFNYLFQIRWKEPLGRPECPYLYRWTLIIFGFSIRLHHWIRSDDRRYFHDHASNFISIVLRGNYTNVTPCGSSPVKSGQVWYSDALRVHYLEIPDGGAWTLLLCGRRRKNHNWGFWVNGKKKRPLKYFYKYGIIQDENY